MTNPNLVHAMDAAHVSQMNIERRYDRDLMINDVPYRVSFLNFFQKIVYTNLEDPSLAGEFEVANGHIGSYEPHDFILIREVEDELKRTHQL